MAKKFLFRGKTLEELEKMEIREFSLLLTSRERRSLKRGLTRDERKLLERIRDSKDKDKLIRTKARDMIILPEMVGVTLLIHNGKEFSAVDIQPEMIGSYLGEFAITNKPVRHGSPGIGASRSSMYVPLK